MDFLGPFPFDRPLLMSPYTLFTISKGGKGPLKANCISQQCVSIITRVGCCIWCVLVAQFLQKQLAHTLHQQVSCLGGAVEQPVARVGLVMGTLSCHDHTSHTLHCTLEFSNLIINVHHIHNIQRKLILVPFP